jgi:hypothetical protein
MPTNAEASAVKARRKATAAKPDEAAPSTPVAVGVDEPARHYPALGDPREPRVSAGEIGAEFSRPHPLATPRDVAEATGWYQGGLAEAGVKTGDFVVAECDVYESILPKGCTTPTSRMRWAKGQHVPAEIYRAWEAERAAALEAAPVAPPPES